MNFINKSFFVSHIQTNFELGFFFLQNLQDSLKYQFYEKMSTTLWSAE